MAMSPEGFYEKIKASITGMGFEVLPGSWMDDFLLGVAQGVYEEITQNARCSGVDAGASGGDSHDAVKIV